MAIGNVQLYDQALRLLTTDAIDDWDVAAARFTFALAKQSYTPNDAHDTVADVTQANLITAGDGAPVAVPSRSITETNGVVQFIAGDAYFGQTVSVPSVKYLLCIQGSYDGGYTLTDADNLLFWVDLNDTGGVVSSVSSEFKIIAPSGGVWFKINKQV